DEALRLSPQDVPAALERCSFLVATEKEDSDTEDFGPCLHDLALRFPGEPRVELYRLERGYDPNAAEQAESLLARGAPGWSREQTARLHAALARTYGVRAEQLEKAAAHAERAMALDPTLDECLTVARRW